MTDPSGWHRRTLTPADKARRAEYDSAAYRKERARLGREVKAGRAYCWRCGRHLPPGCTWHTGHDDNDRSVIRGAECASCNLSAAASKGARTANANRKARKAGLLPPAGKPRPAPVCRIHGAACGGMHSEDW